MIVYKFSNIQETHIQCATGGLKTHAIGTLTFPAFQASYWNPLVTGNITMAVTPTQAASFITPMKSVKLDYQGNIIDNAKKLFRVLGLMAMISYTAVVLFVWIYANLHGYLYFQAGEPILLIKYPEWILGFVGIFASADILRRELYHKAKFYR